MPFLVPNLFTRAGLLSVLLCSTTAFSQSAFLTALEAQSGLSNLKSAVAMSGTATFTAGSTQESGTATYTANTDGSYNLSLGLQTAARTEVMSSLAGGRTCSWTGADGTQHPITGVNCYQPVAWFSPLGLLFMSPLPNIGLTDDGLVTDQGRTLHSLTANVQTGGTDHASQLLAQATRVTVLFDPVTLEPLVMTYSLHPDGDAVQSFPVRVEYSDFRPTGGLLLPYHVDRYLSGTLQLSLQADSVSVQ